MDEFIEDKIGVLKFEYYESVMENLDSFVNSRLRFRTVRLINAEKVTDVTNTFVLPIFFKPGRTHFMMRTQLDMAVMQKM